MSDPYDWTHERSTRWGRGGDASFVTHYELEARMEPVDQKLYDLHQRAENLEDRLIEVRAKHFAVDVITSAWTKFIVIVLAVITAFLLTSVIHVDNPFG